MNANEALANNYMAMDVNLRIWQMHIKDKQAGAELTQDAGASDGSLRVYKSIGNHKAAKAVKSAYSNIQRVWRKNTLPLHSGEGRSSGARICPINDMVRVMKEVEFAKAQAHDALEEFRLEYPDVIQWAAADLGTRFDANDFPDVEDACARFYVSINVDTIPVTTTLDDMASVPVQVVDWLRSKIESKSEERINNALNSLRTKLLEEVSRMASNLDKFANYSETVDENGTKTRAPQLYKSLVTNVQHSLTMLRATAVGDTTKLNELADKIEEKLTQRSVDTLKESSSLSREVARDAQELADAINDDDWSF